MRRHRSTTARFVFVLLTCLTMVGVTAAPGSAAPVDTGCNGWKDAVVRGDGTSFSSRKECRAHVESGGTLLAPRLVLNFVQPFGEWCEPGFGLVDFPPGTFVVANIHNGEYSFSFDYYVDAAGVLNYLNDDGTIGGPVSGFGFSLDVDNRARVSATYTVIDGSTFITSLKYRCPK